MEKNEQEQITAEEIENEGLAYEAGERESPQGRGLVALTMRAASCRIRALQRALAEAEKRAGRGR